MNTSYRLGIDMGATSIGWCMVELDSNKEPCNVLNMGVRIFPDGRDDKSKEPLSVARRNYRSMRRNHDRFLQRMNALLACFDNHNLLPQTQPERDNVFLFDPYELRAKALDNQISLPAFARAVFHLAKRRGFQSNRKTDKENKTAYDFAIQNLKDSLQKSKSRTLGEYLYKRNSELTKAQQVSRQPIKFRYDKQYADEERIFPTRAMVLAEFNLLWDTQATHHPELTEAIKSEISTIIFYQRPLKAQDKGKCYFEPDEIRCSKANPYFQQFRIWQDINNLKLIHLSTFTEEPLDFAEKETIFNLLNTKAEVSFESLRKQILGKDKYAAFRFNFETENKKKLKGNEANAIFNKSAILKPIWERLTLDQQARTVELILSDESDETVESALLDIGFPPSVMETVLNLHLPSAYGNLSSKAISKILPYLKQGLIYDKACGQAGYKHSGTYTGEVFIDGDLPYYGELLQREVLPLSRISYDTEADAYGKINNPTVHIALNQLKKIVNALCERYGAPEQIAIELAREVSMGKDHNDEINKLIKQNTENNERIVSELALMSIPDNRENRTKYKLWEELAKDNFNRCCLYCGKIINQTDLFMPHIQIEHILPRSRTFDDSNGNKTIAHLACNDYKKERSPYEAFGQSKDGYDWAAIVDRAKLLPENKRRRFQTNAMERYQEEGEILARMLNDTRYMTKVAKQYLQYVCGDTNIWTVNGQLTKNLRDKWRLNTILSETNNKERTDHRHHAIDAFTIAMADRSIVKRFADSMKYSRPHTKEAILNPYYGYTKEQLAVFVERIKVSFKPDHVNPALLQGRHQTGGALMQETAYAFEGIDPKDKKFHLYSKKYEVSALTIKDIDTIKSPDLKADLIKHLGTLTDEKQYKQRLTDWAKKKHIHKIKLLIKLSPKTMIPVKDKHGKAYKYFSSDENLYADIYNPRPFDPNSKWHIEICNSYWLHQPAFVPQWKQDYPMAKLIMRVYKTDIVAVTNDEGKRELKRVRKMSKGLLWLSELNLAKKPDNLIDKEKKSVHQLQEMLACKAGIDILGRCFDPNADKIE